MILELLRKITNGLNDRAINYMLTGSIAMSHYTIPRMTLDIDIVIELEGSRVQEFLSIFYESYYYNENTIIAEVSRKGMFNVIDHETGLKVDFIIRKDSVYKKLEFSRRTKANISNIAVYLVSPEDLIIAKLESVQILKSEKHMNDIRNLMELPQLDTGYISQWCKKMNLETFKLL